MRRVPYSIDPTIRAAVYFALAMATALACSGLSLLLYEYRESLRTWPIGHILPPAALIVFALVYRIFNNVAWKWSWVVSFTQVPNLGGQWFGEIVRRNDEGEEDQFPVKVVINQDFSTMSVEVVALTDPSLGDGHTTESKALSMQVATYPRVTVHDVFQYRGAEGVAKLTFQADGIHLVGEYFSSARFEGRITAQRASETRGPVDGQIPRLGGTQKRRKPMSKYNFTADNVQIIESGDGIQDNRKASSNGMALRRSLVAVRDLTSGGDAVDVTHPAAQELLDALQGQERKIDELRLMLDDLWLKHATQEMQTGLQKFVRSLPEKGAWEVLKTAAKGLLL